MLINKLMKTKIRRLLFIVIVFSIGLLCGSIIVTLNYRHCEKLTQQMIDNIWKEQLPSAVSNYYSCGDIPFPTNIHWEVNTRQKLAFWSGFASVYNLGQLKVFDGRIITYGYRKDNSYFIEHIDNRKGAEMAYLALEKERQGVSFHELQAWVADRILTHSNEYICDDSKKWLDILRN